jgi:hypothetical protein
LIGTDYRGKAVMAAYHPATFLGAKFAIVAEADLDEI